MNRTETIAAITHICSHNQHAIDSLVLVLAVIVARDHGIDFRSVEALANNMVNAIDREASAIRVTEN